ncbi:GA module-containing protein [Mycoplasma sp. U97]|uniref:GA module-containing protein n=1 Tax=Mycoplasma tauri TaxID=547987 RepID=UPI001CBDEE39|nr:GA module-containing protein [Mycoplasma tauri]MBZ4212406.1 GA module-containing protein [Mycoplasma tauri]
MKKNKRKKLVVIASILTMSSAISAVIASLVFAAKPKEKEKSFETKKNETDLRNEKNHAFAIIENLTKISQTEKDEYKSKIENINNPNEYEKINEIVEDAKQEDSKRLNETNSDDSSQTSNQQSDQQSDQTVTQEQLNVKKINKKAEVSTLTDLPEPLQNEFIQQIEAVDNPKNSVQIETILENAKAKNEQYKELKQSKTTKKNELNSLSKLPSNERANYEQQIEAVDNPDDSARIDEIVQSAKDREEQYQELNTNKIEVTQDINELNELPQEVQNQYKDQITNITTPEQIGNISQILQDAKAKNEQYKELKQNKTTKKNELNSLSKLPSNERANYEQQIEAVDNPDDSARIDEIVQSAKDREQQYQELSTNKVEATQDINELNELPQEVQNEYKNQITNITTPEQIGNISQILQNAKTQNEQYKELKQNKNEKKAEVSTLTDLPEPLQNEFIRQIEAVNNPKNSAQIETILENAKTKNEQYKELKQNKTTKKNELNSLSKLPSNERANYEQQIEAVDNPDDSARIDEIVQSAKDREQQYQELSTNKVEATQDINELNELPQEVQNEYKDQITNITTPEQIGNISQILQNAKTQNEQYKELKQNKNEKKAEVSTLTDLPEPLQNEFIRQIEAVDNPKNSAQIETILENAKTQNEQYKELKQNKTTKKNELNSLSKLPSNERANYEQQIEAINNPDDSSRIDEIVQSAKDREEQYQELSTNKVEATQDINELNELPQEVQNEYKDQITNITTPEQIGNISQILQNAKTQNEQYKELKQNKNEKKAEVSTLTDLPEPLQNEFIQQIEAVDDPKNSAQIETILKNAKTKNDQYKELKQNKTTKKNELNSLSKLPSNERANYEQQIEAINNPDDSARIDEIVQSAKDREQQYQELSTNKVEATQDINELNELPQEVQNKYKDQITNITTPEQIGNISQILQDAKTKNEQYKELKDKKEQAILNIDQLIDIPETRRQEIKNNVASIVEPDNINNVSQILQDAKREAQLWKVKNDAKRQIKELIYLELEMKNQFESEIDRISNENELHQIVERAEQADIQARIKQAKDNGKNQIQELQFLGQDKKDQYKGRIDLINSVEQLSEIESIFEQAKNDDKWAELEFRKKEAETKIQNNDYTSPGSKQTRISEVRKINHPNEIYKIDEIIKILEQEAEKLKAGVIWSKWIKRLEWVVNESTKKVIFNVHEAPIGRLELKRIIDNSKVCEIIFKNSLTNEEYFRIPYSNKQNPSNSTYFIYKQTDTENQEDNHIECVVDLTNEKGDKKYTIDQVLIRDDAGEYPIHIRNKWGITTKLEFSLNSGSVQNSYTKPVKNK